LRIVKAVTSIECDNAGKVFRRFSERNQTLKQAITRRRRAVFSEHWAVRNLTLKIEEGETFGIIGGNGAGKSTTLKMLAGILVPDEGSVTVNGRVSALLELGAGFHPELSGRENVFLNGAILGMSRKSIAERFDEIVGFAGLEDAIDTPIKTYSSGMFARLGFAVAVNVDPDVLLLDEVLAVGDQQFQRKCGERIAALRASGRTVVIVSHGLSELQTMCSSVAWIDHGQVRAIGPATAVINEYLDSIMPNTRVDGEGLVRTGSGEATVKVHMKPPRPTEGHCATLCFSIEATQFIEEPRLGFTLRRSDGLTLSGITIAVPEGIRRGVTECTYTIPSLPLLAGSYEITVRLADRTGGHEIDACTKAGSFDVAPPDTGSTEFGLIGLIGSWDGLGSSQS
jgi:ABC-type polysaccharide/polyol phosphate transport system ATPase subunit